MHLSIHDHRVDHVAHVVYRQVALQLHVTRIGADFDDGDVCAERENEVGRVVEAGRLQRRLDPLGQVVGQIGLQCHVGKRLRLVGRAFDVEVPVIELQVLLGGLQQMRGDRARLVDDLLRGRGDRAAAGCGAATAVGAPSVRHDARITLDYVDIIVGYAQGAGDDLRVRRFMALSVSGAAAVDRHLAGRVDAHYGALPLARLRTERADHGRRRQATGFDVGGEAESQVLAIVPGSGLVPAKVVVANRGQRFVESAFVIAAVVFERDLRGVGEVVGRHKVSAPDLCRVDAGDARGLIDYPLHDECRFRPARAAIGVDRNRMREDAVDMAVNCGKVVFARHQRAVEIGWHGRGERREIGPHRRVGIDSEADELPVGVYRHFGVRHMVAAMCIGNVGLGARRRPLNGTPDLHRGPRRDRLVGIVMNLASKPSANLRGDDPDLVLR